MDTETETEGHLIAEEPRIRQLTEKAANVYEDRVKHCTVELSILWDRVDHVIQCVDKHKDDLVTLQEVEKKLTHNVENFDKYTDSFREYLTRTRTQDSLSELHRLDFLKKGYDLLIENAKRRLKTYIGKQNRKEENSESSYRSGTTSTRTSQSSIIARKSAKAEAAKVSLQFAKEAAELKKKQALIEQQYALETASAKARAERQKIETQADLELLRKEQEAAEAEAEVNVLRSFDGDEQRSLPSLPESDSHTRTKNYIKNLIAVPQQDPAPPSVPPASIHPEVRQREELPANVMSSLDPNAPPYKPANTQSLSSDFTKFLLKKDLLLTRLTSFNDKPETYAS